MDADDDVARRIFHRIGDRLGNQKPERYSQLARQGYLCTLDDDGPPGALLQQQVGDIDAQRAQVLLEFDVLLAIEEMQSALGYGCNVEIDMAQASREFVQYTIYSTNVYTIYTVASKASIAFLERAALEAYAAMDEAFRRAR